ncbi:MAG: hypothetical protein II625_06980 [Bacilli bacterium]|nr:hypothetical protein [Bacilli bacterium]
MINLKKEFSRIEKIFKYLNIEKIEEMGITAFLNKDTIYAKTSNEAYLVNVVSLKEQESDYSKNKIARIKSLEFFDKNGVHCLFPMSFNEKYFIDYHGREYEVYKYVATEHLSKKDINDKKLKKIATSQAIIHNLNIKVNLPCEYKIIKIEFNRKTAKLEKYSNEAYKLLYEYIYPLEEIIDHNNKLLKYASNFLILGYDNYDLNNIEWVKDYMFLVDYNNCKLINPTVSLAESAYYFSCDKELDIDKYEKYLSTYLKRNGNVTFDYKEALYVSQNKRLVELENLINSSIKNKEDYSEKMIPIINEIISYNNNIDKMNNAYLNIVKKQSN